MEFQLNNQLHKKKENWIKSFQILTFEKKNFEFKNNWKLIEKQNKRSMGNKK